MATASAGEADFRRVEGYYTISEKDLRPDIRATRRQTRLVGLLEAAVRPRYGLVGELAAQLGVHRVTVWRDMQALRGPAWAFSWCARRVVRGFVRRRRRL